MNLDKLMEDFALEYLKRSPYVDKESLIQLLSDIKFFIHNNQDKTPEEIITLLIEDNIKQIDKTRKKYGIPGYHLEIKVGKIRIKFYGGKINSLNEPMKEDALFDIASMTKFYTQAIAYNLLKEKVFSLSDQIKDLDNRFVNLSNLTIGDILTFGTTFETDGRISDKKTIDEALNTLYHVKVIEKDKYNYNDIGLMIIKEVMEKLTNLSYSKLLDKYILKPLNLTNTHVIVPKNKYHLITGTPNFKYGLINDMTALAVGGYSGHAGIFASSDDLISLMEGVRKEKIVPNISDAWTKGNLNDAIGKMGNTYVAHPKGLDKTFIDITEPKDSFAIAGSTRVNLNSSSDSSYTVLFNPSSMNIFDAKERITLINAERKRQNLPLINPLREYEFIRDNKFVHWTLLDPRMLVPVDIMGDVIKKVARTTLKLRFINYMIDAYDKNYKDIDITNPKSK